MTLPTSTNLSDGDLVTQGNTLLSPHGVTLRVIRNRIRIVYGENCNVPEAVKAMKLEAARLRALGSTPEGYQNGLGLHAQRFEIMGALIRLRNPRA